MTQYKKLKVKLPYKKLSICLIKNGTQVIINFSPNVAGESNDETNFPHKLQKSSTQMVHQLIQKFSKTELSNMIQLGGSLSRLLGPLLKTEKWEIYLNY